MSDHRAFYYERIAAGELHLQYCSDCNSYIFYPRRLCPYCFSKQLSWSRVSGKGVLYSYTVVRTNATAAFEQEIPYIYALIELDEGVRIISNLVDCNFDEIAIDMPVEFVSVQKGGTSLAAFRPAFG